MNDYLGRVNVFSGEKVFEAGKNLFNETIKKELDISEIISKEKDHISCKRIDELILFKEKCKDTRNLIHLFSVRNLIVINFLFRELFTVQTKNVSKFKDKERVVVKDCRMNTEYEENFDIIRTFLGVNTKDYIVEISDIYDKFAEKMGFITFSPETDFRLLSKYLLVKKNKDISTSRDITRIDENDWYCFYKKIFAFSSNNNTSCYDNKYNDPFFYNEKGDLQVDDSIIARLKTEEKEANFDWKVYNETCILMTKLLNEFNLQSIISANIYRISSYMKDKENSLYDLVTDSLADIRDMESIFSMLNKTISKYIKWYTGNDNLVRKDLNDFTEKMLIQTMTDYTVRDTLTETNYGVSMERTHLLNSKNSSFVLHPIDKYNHQYEATMPMETLVLNSPSPALYTLLAIQQTEYTDNSLFFYKYHTTPKDSIMINSMTMFYTFNLNTASFINLEIPFNCDRTDLLKELDITLDREYYDIVDTSVILKNLNEVKVNIFSNVLSGIRESEKLYPLFKNIFNSNLYRHNNVNIILNLTSDIMLRKIETDNVLIPHYWELLDHTIELKDLRNIYAKNYSEDKLLKPIGEFKISGFRDYVKSISSDVTKVDDTFLRQVKEQYALNNPNKVGIEIDPRIVSFKDFIISNIKMCFADENEYFMKNDSLREIYNLGMYTKDFKDIECITLDTNITLNPPYEDIRYIKSINLARPRMDESICNEEENLNEIEMNDNKELLPDISIGLNKVSDEFLSDDEVAMLKRFHELSQTEVGQERLMKLFPKHHDDDPYFTGMNRLFKECRNEAEEYIKEHEWNVLYKDDAFDDYRFQMKQYLTNILEVKYFIKKLKEAENK